MAVLLCLGDLKGCDGVGPRGGACSAVNNFIYFF